MEISNVELVLSLTALCLFIVLVFLFLQINNLKKTFKNLTKESEGKNLEEILNKQLKQLELNENEINNLKQAFEKYKKESRSNLQKIGFQRYNPFHETGGNQSFVLVLLDLDNNGFILSSLHQREVTRVYSKLITNGKSNFKLSDEEKSLLEKTLK